MQRSGLLAVLATVVALVLATLPALFSVSVTYSPNLAVLTATLIAVVWYTAFTFQLMDFTANRERERARRSVATGLLSELSRMDKRLRNILTNPRHVQPEDLPSPILNHALDQMDLFSPGTAWLLSSFWGELEEVRVVLKETQRVEARGGVSVRIRAELANLVRFPVAMVPRLVATLQDEGGLMGDIAQYPGLTAEGELPVPPSPFQHVADDGEDPRFVGPAGCSRPVRFRDRQAGVASARATARFSDSTRSAAAVCSATIVPGSSSLATCAREP